jgi:hypothetical protein
MCPKILNSHALPLFEYPIKLLSSITFFWNLEGYCAIALTKPKKKTLPTSFYNNIVNHEIKYFLRRYLFNVHLKCQTY